VTTPGSAQAAAKPKAQTRSTTDQQTSATTSGSASAAAREPAEKRSEIDTRLQRKVTLRLKGISLADFCSQMQEQTGAALRASRGVADEKVTVIVKEEPARDVMRAVARLFGYLWERSGSGGEYRYVLDQDLKSRLVEEELRNRDLHAALLSVDAEMEKFRPYRELS
jgi:hypothetical protein